MTGLYLERFGNIEVWVRANGNLVCERCGESYPDGTCRGPTGDRQKMNPGDRCEKRFREGVRCAGFLLRCGRPAEDIERLNTEAEHARKWKSSGSDTGDRLGERFWNNIFTNAGQEARKRAIEREAVTSGDKG